MKNIDWIAEYRVIQIHRLKIPTRYSKHYIRELNDHFVHGDGYGLWRSKDCPKTDFLIISWDRIPGDWTTYVRKDLGGF